MKTNHSYYNQIKQIILIIFILFFFNSNIYSQTMDLYDVEYHNTQIPQCSSIDFNLGTEINLETISINSSYWNTNSSLTKDF